MHRPLWRVLEWVAIREQMLGAGRWKLDIQEGSDSAIEKHPDAEIQEQLNKRTIFNAATWVNGDNFCSCRVLFPDSLMQVLTEGAIDENIHRRRLDGSP